jgi:hypothetical protein
LTFSGLILENTFVVFFGSSCRETAKNAIKKIEGKKTTEKSVFFPQLFGQKFLTWTSPKKFLMVFLNSPLLRNVQKKRHHGTSFSGYLPDIRRLKKKISGFGAP